MTKPKPNPVARLEELDEQKHELVAQLRDLEHRRFHLVAAEIRQLGPDAILWLAVYQCRAMAPAKLEHLMAMATDNAWQANPDAP